MEENLNQGVVAEGVAPVSPVLAEVVNVAKPVLAEGAGPVAAPGKTVAREERPMAITPDEAQRRQAASDAVHMENLNSIPGLQQELFDLRMEKADAVFDTHLASLGISIPDADKPVFMDSIVALMSPSEQDSLFRRGDVSGAKRALSYFMDGGSKYRVQAANGSPPLSTQRIGSGGSDPAPSTPSRTIKELSEKIARIMGD